MTNDFFIQFCNERDGEGPSISESKDNELFCFAGVFGLGEGGGGDLGDGFDVLFGFVSDDDFWVHGWRCEKKEGPRRGGGTGNKDESFSPPKRKEENPLEI